MIQVKVLQFLFNKGFPVPCAGCAPAAAAAAAAKTKTKQNLGICNYYVCIACLTLSCTKYKRMHYVLSRLKKSAEDLFFLN